MKAAALFTNAPQAFENELFTGERMAENTTVLVVGNDDLGWFVSDGDRKIRSPSGKSVDIARALSALGWDVEVMPGPFVVTSSRGPTPEIFGIPIATVRSIVPRVPEVGGLLPAPPRTRSREPGLVERLALVGWSP